MLIVVILEHATDKNAMLTYYSGYSYLFSSPLISSSFTYNHVFSATNVYLHMQVHDAFKAFPEHACVILRTLEQHDQGRLIMRLFWYGNSMKPPKECSEATGESFECVDMLTTEYHGAQACKLGSVSSGNRAVSQKVAKEKPPSLRQHSQKA